MKGESLLVLIQCRNKLDLSVSKKKNALNAQRVKFTLKNNYGIGTLFVSSSQTIFMKLSRILFFIGIFTSFLTLGQEKITADQIDSLIHIRQPNAAQKKLWLWMDQAQKNKNQVALVKAVPYFEKVLYLLDNKEKAQLYFKLLKRVNTFPQPSKALARLSLLNELMYNNYRWFPSSYIPLYDSLDFSSRAVRFRWVIKNSSYLRQQLDSLQQVDFSPYQNELLKGNDSLYISRTVSDYIAYKMINLYQSPLLKNGGELKMAKDSKKDWYASTYDFTQLKLSNHTLTERVLQLFQKIERNNVDNLKFLSTAVYLRLRYLDENYTHPKWMENVWKSAFEVFKHSGTRSKFMYEEAKTIYLKGKAYHFKRNPSVERKIKQADSLLVAEQKTFPKNDFHYEIQTLIATIKSKDLKVSLPNSTVPHRKIPLLMDYRNVTHQRMRIYKLKPGHPLQDLSFKDNLKNNQLQLVRSQVIQLENDNLFQHRSTEMLLDALDKEGEYYVVFSDTNTNLQVLAKDYKAWNATKISVKQLTVSSLGVAISRFNNDYTLLVVNQKTGKPVKGAQINLYKYRNSGKWINYKSKVSDANGRITFSIPSYENLKYIVRYKDAIVKGEKYFYNQRKTTMQTTTKLITDRSIYRPGQTVYFKGIVYRGKENEFTVVPSKKIEISLKDASRQEIYKETFTSNSYGSINGAIQLPEELSLGQFTLYAKPVDNMTNSSVLRFHVEEYKRPTFEVKLNSPTKTAQLNDTVTLVGNAMAIAGYPISGAKVAVSVYRKWNRYWQFYFDASSGDKLMQDSLTTDKDGNFTVNFFAATDPNAMRNAFYYYEVKVKVTDVSGETHEQTTTLRLNKVGLALQLDMPNRLILNQDSAFAVLYVVNLAGKIQKNDKGTIRIYKKANPDKFMDRIWDNAQYSRFTTDEFTALFPYRITNVFAPIKKKNWIKEITFQSGDTLSINDWLTGQQGDYGIVATVITDKGDTLSKGQDLTIIDETSKVLPKKQALWVFLPKNKMSIGDKFTFQVGSSFKNEKALVTLRNSNDIIIQKWVDLKNRVPFSHLVNKEDRGGMVLDVILFYNGKFYTQQKNIIVPLDDKKLKIKTSTFRDKLQPGAKEQWRFTIQDNKGDWAKAELAAAMYDASLDEIYGQNWYFTPYVVPYMNKRWESPSNRSYSSIGFNGWSWKWEYLLRNGVVKYRTALLRGNEGYFRRNQRLLLNDAMASDKGNRLASVTVYKEYLVSPSPYGQDSISSGEVIYPPREEKLEKEAKPAEKIVPRSNFNETAFFYPTIYSDSTNKYNLNFTLPESLTKWKLLLLAHTKDMKIGELQKVITAKKELMITANAPRFVREGDEFYFSAKVVNLTDSSPTVTAHLDLKDAISNEKLEGLLQDSLTKTLILPPHTTKPVSWQLKIGNQNLLQYVVTVHNDHFSDGEQNIIPVLSNRTLIINTKHQIIRDTGKTEVDFKDFLDNQSSTLDNKSYTVEYIDNLAWNAVLALPYLSKATNKSTTALMNSYYANAIATDIINRHPEVKAIFNQWKNKSPEMLWSALQKNEKVKSILLNETPWVMAAKNETEQRRRIAQLFQLNQLKNKQNGIFRHLINRQNGDGGFGWFDNGRSNVYITQSILTQFGHLKRLGISTDDFNYLIQKAAQFLSSKQVAKYLNYQKMDVDYQLSAQDVQWLYTRLYFHSTSTNKVQEVINSYSLKLKTDWTEFSPYLQAMIGIYCKENGMDTTAHLIYSSLLDRAHTNKLGMYWVENSGYFWYQNKVATQAMLISFFQIMKASKKIMDNSRLWLILNKETNAWGTNTETAEAIYAILSTGRDYLKETKMPKITVGKHKLVMNKVNNNEIQVNWTPGTGQLKQTWQGKDISPDLGKIEINKSSTSPSAVSVFWKYTEEMDKVKKSQSDGLQIKKEYFQSVPGAKKEVAIKSNDFEMGDKIKVVLTITVDRTIDFVHIKDLRPAGFEPITTTSGYHWSQNLAYYQSPKDASMNYYIEQLSKGSYQLSYYVYAMNKGTFSSGIATVQCFYSPSFAGNSDSKVIEIK